MRTSWVVPIAVLAAAVVVVGTSAGDSSPTATPSPAPAATTTTPTPSDAPSPTPAPSPSPTYELTTVQGERVPAAYNVTSAGMLGPQTRPAPDDAAILDLIHRVGDWLDAHLDDLQRGGPGKLEGMALPGLLAEASPGQLEKVTTALASPEHPVASASYRLAAYHEDTPEWLEAAVSVTHPDGGTAQATLVFMVDSGGNPKLIMFSPVVEQGAA